MKKRYTILDILRGLALISMIIYHGVWDLVYIFRVDLPWFRSEKADLWQQSILWTFVLLSGFCCSLGKKKLKRAITVLVCSLIISVVTLIFMPQNFILFGVLSLLGTGMLVTIPLDKVFRKISPYLGVVLCALLFALARDVVNHRISLGELTILQIPDFLYANDITAYLGFPPDVFSSSDYVPVIPWIFLYWVGYFIYRIFERKNLLKYLSAVSIKPLEWLGKQSLYIYMLHQPIVYGLLYVIFKII